MKLSNHTSPEACIEAGLVSVGNYTDENQSLLIYVYWNRNTQAYTVAVTFATVTIAVWEFKREHPAMAFVEKFPVHKVVGS